MRRPQTPRSALEAHYASPTGRRITAMGLSVRLRAAVSAGQRSAGADLQKQSPRQRPRRVLGRGDGSADFCKDRWLRQTDSPSLLVLRWVVECRLAALVQWLGLSSRRV